MIADSVDDATLADNTDEQNDGSDDPLAALRGFFEAQEPPQDDTDESDADEGDADDSDAEQTESEKEALAAEDGEENIETEADFDALEKGSKEYLDADAIKAKFPRNASKDLIELAATYSADAEKGAKLVEALGGEHYVPHIEAIASGLQEGDFHKAMIGIAEATGEDGLLNLLATTLHLGIVGYKQLPDDYKPFQERVEEITNAFIAQRFGQSATVENLEKMAAYAEQGWLEKISRWIENDHVDYDELEELLAVNKNPKLQAALKREAELKAALEEKKAAEQAKAAEKEQRFDDDFRETITGHISKTLDGTVWAKSPLRDLPTDTADIKAEKAIIRQALKQTTTEQFMRSPKYSELVKDYGRGKGHTAAYKKALVDEMNAAILKTRQSTATAERLVSRIYGTTRNGRIATQKQQARTAAAGQPTVTEAGRGRQAMTPEEIRADLRKRIEALG